MAEVKIWHNTRCKKSREGLNYLREKNIEPEIFEYMKEGFRPEELANIIRMSDQPLDDFIRQQEKEYKTLGLKDRRLTPESFAEIAAEHPRLLQRPIVIKGQKAVMARPASRAEEVL